MRMRFRRRKKKPALWKGILAGAVGGAVGTFAMNYAHIAYAKVEKKVTGDEGNETDSSESESAPVKAARKIAEPVIRRNLTKAEKELGGQVMHWVMGVGSGATYGAIATSSPAVTMGAGLPFGAVLWALADEIAVPAAGLSEPPTEVPVSVHTEALTSHLVYGLVTELVRDGVMKLLDSD